jgi:uncharacterized protein
MVVPTVDTNGNIGPTDTLMITDHTNCETGLNVLRNDLSEISKNNKFRWIMQQALTLPEKCKQCDLCLACAGGYLPHRWSNKTKDFQNPSAYCDDLKKLIKHIDVFLMKDVIRHVKPRGASSLN